MIYAIFGSPLTITANCGMHKVPGYLRPVHLVQALCEDDQKLSCFFAHTLKADGGLNEIDATITAAPSLTLTGRALVIAIQEAD